jgi:hypothetical protein
MHLTTILEVAKDTPVDILNKKLNSEDRIDDRYEKIH